MSGGQLVFGGWTEKIGRSLPVFAQLRRNAEAGLRRRTMSVSTLGLEVATGLSILVCRSCVLRMHWRTSLRGYSFARLIRTHDAYCPSCLRSDSEPYSRICWELGIVRACDKHGCVLVQKCPRCRRNIVRQNLSAEPWLCPLCGHDRRTDSAGPADPQEMAVATEVGKVVALITADRDTALLTGSVFASRIISAAEHPFTRSVKRVAEQFGASASTISLWRREKANPSLVRLCECAIRKRIPLSDMLRGELSRKRTVAAGAASVWKMHTLGASHREHIRRRMAEAADNPFRPAAKLAIDLNVCSRTLRSLDPDMYEHIRVNYAANRRRIQQARLQWFCGRVAAYVGECLSKHDVPTWRGLGRFFNKPGILRDPVKRCIAKNALSRGKEAIPYIPTQLELHLV